LCKDFIALSGFRRHVNFAKQRRGNTAMRKLVVSAIALGFLISPAFAQKRDDDPLVIIEREKKQQAEAVDKQYKRTLDQTRKEVDAPRNDPWAHMRGSNDGKR
jgi:hypothetical protein